VPRHPSIDAAATIRLVLRDVQGHVRLSLRLFVKGFDVVAV